MEKQKLWKLKRLEATDEMLELAGKDIPIITNVPYEKMEYPTGLYVRTELEDNILILHLVEDVLLTRYLSIRKKSVLPVTIIG